MSGYKLVPEGDWKPLLLPIKYVSYINDHAVFKDKKSNWRLLGTSALGDYAFYKERSFVEGVTPKLTKRMKEVGKNDFPSIGFGIKIAPCVFFDKNKNEYHLFFGPGIISHYRSSGGEEWIKCKNAVFSLWPALRDPYVIEIDGKYLMYLTDFGNKISVYQSEDLFKWTKFKTVFTLGDGIPKTLNSSCESSKVISWKDKFFLLTTIVPANKLRKENYNKTHVFVSDDPTDFGQYSLGKGNSASHLGVIDAHAPEIIIDGGRLYITTCGWKGYPKAVGISQEGVFIRRLRILEG